MTKLHLIWAQSANGAIGIKGKLPWHLPEDLAHFKHATMNFPVIMGRKTWDSLPPKFRPLPGRFNIVITRQKNWHSIGAHRASSIEDALRQCASYTNAWIIGGAQMYSLAIPLAESALVTEIEGVYDGDAFAPTLDAQWQESRRENHTSSNGMRYSFVTYTRIKKLL